MGCKSSVLIYSMTGVGKTGQVGSWAKWLRQKYGPATRCRLVSAEPEGFDTIRHLIDDGLIEALDIRLWPYSSETLSDISKGYWPVDVTKPGSELKPTSTELLGKAVTGLAFEGMESLADWVLAEMRELGAQNLILSAEKAPAQYTSGRTRFAGNNETHYGIAQSKIHDCVNNSHRLPVHMLWTSKEIRAKDRTTGNPIYGPAIAGSAATYKAPGWFGHTIHLDVAPMLDEKTKTVISKRKAFLVDHYDPNDPTTPYRAQVRLPVELSEKEGKIPVSVDLSSNTMIWFMDFIEQLQAEAKQLQLAIKK